MTALTESSITSDLLKYLRSQPDTWRYKIPDIGKKSKPFDIIGTVKGQLVVLELKVIKTKTIKESYYESIYHKLEPVQAANSYQIQKVGGYAFIGGYIQSLERFIFYPFTGQTNQI